MAKEYRKNIRTRSATGWTRDTPLYEIFADGILRWFGSGVTRVTTHADKGSGSAQFDTNAELGYSASIGRNFPKVDAERIVIRFSIFMFTNAQANSEFEVIFQLGVNGIDFSYIPTLRFDFDAADNFDINISEDWGDTYESLEDNLPYGGFDGFVPIELIVDLATKKYVSLKIGSKEFDISEFNLNESSVTRTQPSCAYFCLTNTSAAAQQTRLDNVVVEYL